MEKVAELRSGYIHVKDSYGGSQEFFAGKKGFFQHNKKRGGCGVVAMADTLSYMTGGNSFADPEDYMRYFNKIARRILWIPTKYGMTVFRIAIFFPMLLSSFGLHLRCRWGLSVKKIPERITEMVSNNIPVILNIPKPVLPISMRKKKIHLYTAPSTSSYSVIVSAHFVVATGIFKDPDTGKYMIQISSWGKKYYIDFDEYREFTKKILFGGFMGNILYIKIP